MPFLLLSAADCVVTVLTQKNAVLIAQSSTVFGRVGNALLAYVTYLDHLIYPVGLTVAYAHPDISPSLWRVGWAVALLAAISVGVLAGRRKHPYLVMGWLWYLGMLLPVIDIMQAAHKCAGRPLYLPAANRRDYSDNLGSGGTLHLLASSPNRAGVRGVSDSRQPAGGRVYPDELLAKQRGSLDPRPRLQVGKFICL